MGVWKTCKLGDSIKHKSRFTPKVTQVTKATGRDSFLMQARVNEANNTNLAIQSQVELNSMQMWSNADCQLQNKIGQPKKG